jgi:adenylate cyclase
LTKALSAAVFTAFVIGLVLLRSLDPPLFVAARGAGFDTFQRLWPRLMLEPQPVRVIDIDEPSLKELGQWPWPRTALATLTAELMELGAAAVAFDIVFPEPDRMSPRRVFSSVEAQAAIASNGGTLDASSLPDNDAIFAQAISGRPVVLAFALSGAISASTAPLKAGFAQTGLDATNAPVRLTGITNNIPTLEQAATGIGSISIDLANDQGVARQIPFLSTDGTRLYPSLAAETLRVAQGADTFLLHASADTENAINSLQIGDLEVPLSETGMFQMYYRPDLPDLYVSAARVIAGTDRDALRPLIEGHVVFVGTSAVGLLDIRTSALGESIPGVSIHAQATEQILSGTYLMRPEWAAGAEIIFVLLAGLAVATLAALVRPRTTVIAFATLATLVLAVAVFSFRNAGLLLDITFPLFSLALVFLTSIALRLLVADKEGRRMRGAFAQYVAPTVLAEIERNPQSLKLGGEMRDVTVMFVDIENFTPLSEKLDPVSLVSVVNRLLEAGSQAILAERGTIDKYIGDAIMAFWNAPLTMENHQYHAAKAALGIRKAVAQLNEEPDLSRLLAEKGAPRLAVRVGIASGPVCVGNMGSSERFDYSVLGETVNTAARTESTCKSIGFDIAIAGDLRGPTADLATLYAGALPMKGKSRNQPIHIVLNDEEHARTNNFMAFRKTYTQLLDAMPKNKNKKPSTALLALFGELADQHPPLGKFLEKVLKRPLDFVMKA